jgi:type I site-specific restriction endonuclease
VLTGKEVADDDNEEQWCSNDEIIMKLDDNVTLPHDFFDVIIIDDAHL